MSKVIKMPPINENLFQFWSKKYGHNETIIISKYIKNLALQFPERYKFGQKEPFEVVMTIEFHLNEIHKFFPELKKIDIKKSLESLKIQGLINWHKDLKTSPCLFFLKHEILVKELLSFEENFYVE